MRNELLSIGEVAKLKGVGIKSLRYYERIGIFKPAYVDEATGYRYYSMTQMPELDVIITSIELGIPLKELEAYRKPSGALDLEAMLERGRTIAKQRLDEARSILMQVETHLDEIHEQREFDADPSNIDGECFKCLEDTIILTVPLAAQGANAPRRTDGSSLYMNAMTKLYALAKEIGCVPLYKQGIAHDPFGELENPVRRSSGFQLRERSLQQRWLAYLEIAFLEEGVHSILEAAKLARHNGATLLSIPAGAYRRWRIPGSSYEEAFTRARNQAAGFGGLTLASDMWESEIDPRTCVFELLVRDANR